MLRIKGNSGPSFGQNTDIEFGPDVVRKTSRRVFAHDQAVELAHALVAYAASLEGVGLMLPDLLDTGVIPARRGYRVRHVMRRCAGPNLETLRGAELDRVLRPLLCTVAAMPVFGDGDSLCTPFDPAAHNFHVADGTAVCTDIYPPLVRSSDGSFPFQMIQYSTIPIRREFVPYTRGTVEGATLYLLFSALLGSQPLQQAVRMARGRYRCSEDIIPTLLPQSSQARIASEVSAGFLGHYLKSTASDGLSLLHKLVRRPAFPAEDTRYG